MVSAARQKRDEETSFQVNLYTHKNGRKELDFFDWQHFLSLCIYIYRRLMVGAQPKIFNLSRGFSACVFHKRREISVSSTQYFQKHIQQQTLKCMSQTHNGTLSSANTKASVCHFFIPSEMTRGDVFTSSSANTVIGFKSMSKCNSMCCLQDQK